MEPLTGFNTFSSLWLRSQEEGADAFSSLKLCCMLGQLHDKPYCLSYEQYRTIIFAFEIWILLLVLWYLFEFSEAVNVGSLQDF